MKCSNCGTENNSLAMFCRKCGAKVKADESGTFRPGDGGKGSTMLDPNAPQGGNPYVPPGGAGKGKTVVDPNVPNGPGVAPPGGGGGGMGRKGKTVIDSGGPSPASGLPVNPAASPDRRLVGFIVTFSLEPMGVFFPIYEGRVKIGTDPAIADLVIDQSKDPVISGTHALLLFRRGVLSLRDQDSSNGTFVDIGTVNRDTYPDLYDGRGSANIKEGEFGDTIVTAMEVEDERIVLKDNTYFMLGSTVFKVKLVD